VTWKAAFIRQAENDYGVFLTFNRSKTPIPVCQQLHYLQMSTEKLAKAFSCPQSGAAPKTSHAALTRFLRISKGRQELRRALGYEGNYDAYVSYIDSILPLAEKIEALAPEGKRLDKPNPEYPWTCELGTAIAPIDYDFTDIWMDAPGINKLKTLIEHLLRIAKS